MAANIRFSGVGQIWSDPISFWEKGAHPAVAAVLVLHARCCQRPAVPDCSVSPIGRWVSSSLLDVAPSLTPLWGAPAVAAVLDLHAHCCQRPAVPVCSVSPIGRWV